MPDSDSILDHPDLRALDDLERREAARAMDDPEERGRLILRILLALRGEARAAGEKCENRCRPDIEKRFAQAETRLGVFDRFRLRVKVLLWLLVVGVPAVAGLFELLRLLGAFGKGGGP